MHQEYDRKLKSQNNEFVLLKCRTTYEKGACNNVRVWLDNVTKKNIEQCKLTLTNYYKVR